MIYSQFHSRDPYNRNQYNPDPYNVERYDNNLANRRYQDPLSRLQPNLDRRYHLDRYPPVGFGRKFYDEIKRLRLMWDENGVTTEYRIRLNVSMPGFWISSGPDNGE